jgi:hypothetical protein
MAANDTPLTMDLSTIDLIDEEESRQFVLVVDGHRARMEYDRSGDRIFLTNLQVPPALDEEQLSAALTEKSLTWADENRMKVVPYCPYVKSYLRKHTAWQRLLVKGVQI